MKSRSVLITGAGGFVGSALAEGFAELGWHVIGLDRAFGPDWGGTGMRAISSDLVDGVPADAGEADVVVHGAWVTTDPRTLGVTTAEYLALNLRPLVSVLEYAARSSPSVFVFLSSSGVFAPTDGSDGLTDADVPTGASPYAIAKRAGELLVPAALGPPTTAHVVRLGYLYGPREVTRPSRRSVSMLATWLAAARKGQPLEVRADDPAREWTFTRDLAGALTRVMNGPPTGRPVHLASPDIYRDSEIAEVITSELGSETTIVPGAGPVKPPMIPSDVPTLRDFFWTDASAGLRALLAAEAVA